MPLLLPTPAAERPLQAVNDDTAEAVPQPGERRTTVWKIRGYLSQRSYWTLAAVGLAVPLACWTTLTAFGSVNRIFLPGPYDVVHRITAWFHDDELLADVGISCFRVVAGWALSALVALPLGLYIGTFRVVQALLEPLTDFVRYMPAVAFIPLVMLWVGIDEGAKIAIIFIGTFFQMVLMVAEDVRRVPMAQIEVAQTLGASCSEVINEVIIRPRSRHFSTRCASRWDGPGPTWSSPSSSRRTQASAMPSSRHSAFFKRTRSSPEYF